MLCSGSTSMGQARYSTCSARAVSIPQLAANMAQNAWRFMVGGPALGWRWHASAGAGQVAVSVQILRRSHVPMHRYGRLGAMATGSPGRDRTLKCPRNRTISTAHESCDVHLPKSEPDRTNPPGCVTSAKCALRTNLTHPNTFPSLETSRVSTSLS